MARGGATKRPPMPSNANSYRASRTRRISSSTCPPTPASCGSSSRTTTWRPRSSSGTRTVSFTGRRRSGSTGIFRPTARQAANLERMGLTIVQVDAFTSTPYAGNPAAVCVLPAARDERWMQDVAREMNLSETAFLVAENIDYLLEVDSEATVRSLEPDFSALRRVEARGVIVTSRAATPGYDFVSRFFAPRAGVNEDPVTGSAHCALAPFWSARLQRTEMTAYQASPRGGVVRVRLGGGGRGGGGGGGGDRVVLGGQAVTGLRGALGGVDACCPASGVVPDRASSRLSPRR